MTTSLRSARSFFWGGCGALAWAWFVFLAIALPVASPLLRGSEPIDILSLPRPGPGTTAGSLSIFQLTEGTIEDSPEGKILRLHLNPDSGQERLRGGLRVNLGELRGTDLELKCRVGDLQPGWISLKFLAPGFLVGIEFSGSGPGVRINSGGETILRLENVAKDQEIELGIRLLLSSRKFSVSLNGESTEEFEISGDAEPTSLVLGFLSPSGTTPEGFITISALTLEPL